jgi:hypothetical protein
MYPQKKIWFLDSNLLPCYKEMQQFDCMTVAPQTNNCTSTVIIIVLLIVVLFMGLCMMCNRPRAPHHHRLAGDAKRDMRCNIPESENLIAELSPEELRQRAAQTYVTSPIANAGTGINNSIGRLPFTPNLGNPSSDEIIGTRAMAGGTPYQSGAFSPSDASAEFYATFQPSNLASMMPANWRTTAQNCGSVSAAQAGASPVKTNFDEFSRYTVSPSQVQKAETMRGTIRLAELTSTRNSRTLGAQSLLRNAVTPLSPVPIGSDMFIFNDSSIRQGFIAAATGKYPEDISC